MHCEFLFAAPPDRRSIYLSESRRLALALLGEGLAGDRPFLVLTGEPGTGKSLLVHDAFVTWGERGLVASLPNPSIERSQVLAEVMRRFGLPVPDAAEHPRLLAAFTQFLAGTAARREWAVLAVDDAHELSPAVLDELRLLAELGEARPLRVLLVGRPALEARLADKACAPVRERIAVQCRLDPLSEAETERYLRFRSAAQPTAVSPPPRAAARAIHELTGGIPRAIDRLVDEAMRRTAAPSPGTLTVAQLRDAAAALSGEAPASAPSAPGDDARAEEETPAGPAAPESVDEPADPEPPAALEPSDTEPPVDGAPPPADRPDVPRVASPAADADPEVRQWVSRFVGSEGPPRIGSRVAFEAAEGHRSSHLERLAAARSDLGLPAESLVALATGPQEPGEGAEIELALASEPRILRHRPRPSAPRRSRRPGRGGIPLVIALVLGLVLALLLFVPRVRTFVARMDLRPAADSSRTAAAPATDPAPVAGGSSAPAIVLTPRERAAARTRAPGRPTPATARTAPNPNAAPAEPRPDPVWYGLEVGSFLSADRAHEEQQRLSALTGLSGRVVTAREDGAEVHRVVLGAYRSTTRADKAAGWLLNEAYVSQARMVRIAR